MITNLLSALAALTAVGIIIESIPAVAVTDDMIDVLSRCTAAVGFLSLSLWISGSPAGVLGVVVTVVLAGVLAITWCVRQERVVVPDDLSELEDGQWPNT